MVVSSSWEAVIESNHEIASEYRRDFDKYVTCCTIANQHLF